MEETQLTKTLELVDALSDGERVEVMEYIAAQWLRQREEYRVQALDLESALMNLLQYRKPTKETYRFIFEQFIAPHVGQLRSGSMIVDQLKKKITAKEKV